MMFSKFAAFYGHVWRSQFKSEGFLEFAKKEWLEGLTPFNEEILNKAIINCRDFYEMPPTLPQMINCCRQLMRRNEFYVAHKPINRVTTRTVIANLQKCKELLSK